MTNDLLQAPTPELRQAFDLEVSLAADALAYIQTNGGREDRELIQRLLNDYAPRLPEVTLALDAAAAGQTPSDDLLPPSVFLAEIKTILEEPERERQIAAVRELQEYRDAQAAQTTIVLSVLVLGLPVIVALLVVIRIFERRENAANLNMVRLEQAALTDSLTSLGNHRAYQEELQKEVEEAHEAGRSLSLAVIDVDEFKDVNDNAGHARGDQDSLPARPAWVEGSL